MALPARDQSISLTDASALTKRYQIANPKAIKGCAFHGDQVLKMLGQPGCVAMRVYYGLNADGTGTVVLTGVDSADNDITGGVLLEWGFPCPLILYLGAAVEAAPVVAAVVRRPVRGARLWIVVWCAALTAANAVSLGLAFRGVHNLWVAYVITGESAFVLWALSFWQTSDTARLTLRVAVVPFLCVWAFLTLMVDNTSEFSRAAQPMACLVCLVAAAYTLLARSLVSRADVLRQDWFWVSAGLALYFGAWSALGPLSELLVRRAPELLNRAYEAGQMLDIASFLAITRGMVFPVET
jgi:hypothetical protein